MFYFAPLRAFVAAGLNLVVLLSLIQSLRHHKGPTGPNKFSVFFPILVDILHHIGWSNTVKFVLPLVFLSVVSSLLAWVFMIANIWRKLFLWSDEDPEDEKTLLGKPLFFPARLTHARFFPEKYNYWINYFLVGIPVGLRGRVGAVISIDTDKSDHHPSAMNYFYSSMTKLFQSLVWFRIDTDWYLHRGDGHLTLTEKLDIFLEEKGEDPSHYPYAYLIGIPQFLWWTKSPISYWYLYSPLKELSAIIMEINNSYGEKKNAFCRLVKEDSSCYEKPKSCTVSSTVLGRGSRGNQTVRFISSAPTAKYYKGNWDKDIFASPFEKVEGSFSLRFMDPLHPVPEKGGPLHSNMTLISTSGKPKISSRLFSIATPIDPLLASSWELAVFLLRWSFVVPVSIGRIVVEAVRIRLRGNLPYLNKSEVKRNNIPRNASETERILEPFFQLYLSHLVQQCSFPLTVIYTPAKSLHIHPVSMRSPAKTLTSAPPLELLIQPLTPQFYTNILKHSDAKSGIFAEIENIPQICDPVSQRLWVSDPVILKDLIESSSLSSVPAKKDLSSGSTISNTSQLPTFMDVFTDANCSSGMCRLYRAARTHYYLTEKFAWGSYKLAAFYESVLRTVVMGLIWMGLWMVCIFPKTSFENVLTVSGIYFMGVRAWVALSGSFYK